MIDFYIRNKKAGISIQKVYESVIIESAKHYCIMTFSVPSEKADPFSLLRNILYAWRKRHKDHVNHITGDIHYLTLVLPPKKTIVTVHDIGFFTNHRGTIRSLLKWLLWIWVLKRSRWIVCISSFTRNQLLSCVNIDEKNVLVINNPVSNQYRPFPKLFNVARPVILHIGTGKNKNLLRTVEALNSIPCHLRIIGKLDDLTRKLLQQNCIDFSCVHGISDSQMLEEYELCDIVNFPSTFEGFGMPIIEGQAVGRVVVTSAIDPMDAIAGGGAYLVDPFDIRAIRSAYIEIIRNPALRENLIMVGRSNVARFTPEQVFQQYDVLYKEILHGH